MNTVETENMVTKEYVKKILYIDHAILFCMGILIFILPIAHTATIRSFALFTPVFLLIIRYYLTKDFTWVKTSFEWPFFAFFIAAIISLFTTADFHESLKEVWGELLVPILLFYAVYFAVRKEIDAMLLLNVLFFSSFVFSIYSFYDFWMHGGKCFSPFYRAGGLRDPGGGEVAALYHTMVIPFLLWGFFHFKRQWQRVGLTVLIVMNLLALHITFTRAAILALMAQISVIIVLLLLKKRWLWSFIITGVFILVSFVYIENKMFREMHTERIPTLQEYMKMSPEDIAGTSPTSMRQRLAMWKTAIDKISENPFYPHGFGRFLFKKSIMTAERNEDFIYPQIHNTFIGIAFELGIQGLIIFLWMIGTFTWVCWRYWRKSQDSSISRYLSASLFTMMLGYWVNNFFGSFDGDDSKLLFMMLLGIGMAVMHRLPREGKFLKQSQ
jgi:O-antigen ligase